MSEELIDITVQSYFKYKYSCGTLGSHFFRVLRDDKKILGRRCSKCGKVLFPPRPVCGLCWAPTNEWVEIGPEGTLEGFTVVRFSFTDPMTGKQRPVPYGYGMVRLDGADSRIQHFLEESDPGKLKVGLRMKAVFSEKRTGSLSDIKHFKVIG